MGEEFITIARVVKTQGRRGEVAAELHTDFPERFEERKEIFALGDDGVRRVLKIDSFWPHKGQIVLKFSGVDSISDAETLIGCELQIPKTERAELAEGEAYVSDLVGCHLWDAGREVGTVTEVRFGAGEAPLLVVAGAKEYEIPFAEAYLERVDLERKEIRMRLPEGMLEVNAPVRAEEKESVVRSQGSGKSRGRADY
jgi:16S rRNA processing protein RimM